MLQYLQNQHITDCILNFFYWVSPDPIFEGRGVGNRETRFMHNLNHLGVVPMLLWVSVSHSFYLSQFWGQKSIAANCANKHFGWF